MIFFVETGWRWHCLYKQFNNSIVEKHEWNVVRLNNYSKLEVVSHVINTLNQTCLDMFKKCPFGHLLDIKIKKIPYQLITNLVVRQCYTKKSHLLVFNLEGNIIEFSIDDLCLLSGLNCEELPIEDIYMMGMMRIVKLEVVFSKTMTRLIGEI